MTTHSTFCSMGHTMGVIMVIITLMLVTCEGIRFNLNPATQRCLKEEMRKGVVVSGEYEVAATGGQPHGGQQNVRVDFQVMDSKGHVAFNRQSIDKGRFAVTADEDDIYDFCVISHIVGHISPQSPGNVNEVYITLKHGVEAKNYQDLAAVSQLKPLEVELTKLEDLSSSIVDDFEHMKLREQEMRDTNESTNNRVFYLSLFSMGCLAGLALWQILYLKKFFKSKKLID